MAEEQKRTVKGVLLDIVNDDAKVVEFEPTLRSYYELLHCDMIEVNPRHIGCRINHRLFDIVSDEEGLFNEGNKISAINNLGKPMFVGSLLVVNRSEDGETASLTDEECRFVLGKIQKMYTSNHPEGYLMLTQCEY